MANWGIWGGGGGAKYFFFLEAEMPTKLLTDLSYLEINSPVTVSDFNQERKISPKRKFLGRTSRGHPGLIRADIPAQNFGQGAQNPGKKKHLGADIHDPKARTPTTLRGF